MCSPPTPSRSASSRATSRSAPAVSLFMFPILAVAAFFVLRGVTRRSQEIASMSATTADAVAASAAGAARRACTRQRRWALWGSYAALTVFVIMFLVAAVLHADDQPEDVGGDLGAERQPLDRASPDAGELHGPDHLPELPDYLSELGHGHRGDVVVSMVISVLAAFSLARMGFWGSQTLATGVFLTYLVPASLLFIPLFQIVGLLGLINNVWCLVLICTRRWRCRSAPGS